MNKVVLALLTHPDDSEFMCTGTLALLSQKGWEINIASMTPGDCGSMDLGREEISKVRKAENAKSAAVLNGSYHCLECEDIFVMYDKPTLLKAIRLIRQVKPAVIFTASPDDYMLDHEMTSRVVWQACFAAGIPNVKTPGVKPCERIPHLYYVDVFDGVDKLGKPLDTGFYVDIGSVIDTKTRMLCCHESQRSWLLAHHGMDQYTATLKHLAKMRGKEVGIAYAEMFRQHLGHSFPQDNILKAELGDIIHTK